MKRILQVVALSVSILAGTAAARADDKQEIATLCSRLEKALKDKKPEDTLALETPDFTTKDGSGQTLNGQQLVEQMKHENDAVGKVTDVKIRILRLAIHGKMAHITSDFHYTAQVQDNDGRMGPKGKVHVVRMSGTVQNDLVKTPAGWRFKTMEQGPGKATMDGKSITSPPQSPRK